MSAPYALLRAEFLTGRYHQRSGIYSTSAGGERLDLDESTIAETYRSVDIRLVPLVSGTMECNILSSECSGIHKFYGFCSGHWGNYFDPMNVTMRW